MRDPWNPTQRVGSRRITPSPTAPLDVFDRICVCFCFDIFALSKVPTLFLLEDFRAAAFFSFFDRARAACGRRARTRDSGPVRDACLRLLARPPVGLGSGNPVASFSSAGNAPPAKLAVALRRRISLAPRRAPSSSPAIALTHTRMRRRKGPPAQRVRAPFSPTPRSRPCLTSCTPHSLRRAVWRTHTVGCPARGGDEAAPQLPYGTRTACSCAAAARGRSCATPPAHSLTTAWRTLRRTLPPETPAYTLRATGPIRAPRCEFALHLPFGRQCTGPASSHGEAAPPTAQRPHCTAACSSHTRLAHDPHR